MSAHAQSARRPPAVVIADNDLPRLESLATGALARMPALADRLLAELARARIVAGDRMPPDVVRIGARVTWRDDSTGRETTARLVLPQEADIDSGRVSVATPIGVALIGLRAGARFSWQTRAGEERNLTVVAVEAA